jgi:type I restriction enzyme S subunit
MSKSDSNINAAPQSSHSSESESLDLPQEWLLTKLESLTTDISYGYTASSTTEAVGPKLLRITDIQNNKVNWTNVPYCQIEEHKLNKYTLQKNDLVFARTGATVGKSFLIKKTPPNSVYASYLIRVRSASEELISMLSHFFNSGQYWQQITEFSTGIGQPNVNGTKLKGLLVPLPPPAEQKIIADKLDELLAQVDTLKARLDAIPAILKRFRQSVLAAAVSGKLTEE